MAFALLIPPYPAVAQEPESKPAVVAYVTGGVPDYMKTFFGAYLLAALINEGAGVNDEVSAAFLAAVNQEQSKRNDVLNDSLICEIGRKYGIRYVCAASITPVPGAFTLSARIMSVKTGKSRFGGETTGPLNVMEDLERATGVLVEKMSGGKRIFGGQTAPEPAQSVQPAQTPPPAAVIAPEAAVHKSVDNAGTASVEIVDTPDGGTEAVFVDQKDEFIAAAAHKPTVSPPLNDRSPSAAPEPPNPSPVVTPEQGKQTVAVYMAGEEPHGAKGVHDIMGGELARVMSESDKYTAVDRTETILQQLDKEHAYQRSGAVDDDQIKAIGHQLGVQYLCISNINAVGKRYYLDTRLVDIVTAEIERSVTATSTLKDAAEMARVGREIALELLEADKTRRMRALRKTIFRSTAIGLDALGVLAFAYGYIENNNLVKYVGKDNGPEATRAETRRNAAYIASAALIASGVTIHIVF